MRAPLNATVFCHSMMKVGVRASPSWLPMISKRAFFPACLASSPQQDVMLACCSVGLRTSLRFTPSFSFNIRARLQANLLFCSLRIFVLITTNERMHSLKNCYKMYSNWFYEIFLNKTRVPITDQWEIKLSKRTF